MLTMMVVASLILTIIVNVATSCYVCYNVALESDEPKSTLMTIGCLVVINALFPYLLGCMTGLWYIG